MHCQVLASSADDAGALARGIDAFWAFFVSEIRRLNAFVADNETVCSRKLDMLNLDSPAIQSESSIINTLTFCKALKEMLPSLGAQLITDDESKIVDAMAIGQVNQARLDAFREFLLAATNLDHLRKVCAFSCAFGCCFVCVFIVCGLRCCMCPLTFFFSLAVFVCVSLRYLMHY